MPMQPYTQPPPYFGQWGEDRWLVENLVIPASGVFVDIGAGDGVAISLGTTVIFLMLIQLTKAVGAKGLIPPEVAAWMPNAVFALIGMVMLARVRT